MILKILLWTFREELWPHNSPIQANLSLSLKDTSMPDTALTSDIKVYLRF